MIPLALGAIFGFCAVITLASCAAGRRADRLFAQDAAECQRRIEEAAGRREEASAYRLTCLPPEPSKQAEREVVAEAERILARAGR
ncbi:MAG TPA: hypothetical protein VMB51_05245 [Solirubrobacteraceae bacterium]|nr:hypothetical protein [Solirubrobacteraceae bacterium]